jgi:SEC-C motif-containing protein
MERENMNEKCPCGGESLETCCGPFLFKGVPRPTALATMKARYSAFVLNEIDFLINSHHPDTRSAVERSEIEEWSKSSTWKGLTIQDVVDGESQDQEGIVEFVCQYELDGQQQIHHERAHFKKEGEDWYFLDGKFIPVQNQKKEIKVGRNEPCPCGSGKKYKKCCLK